MFENYTLTILGCGTMGTAVLSALLSTEFANYPKTIICCTGSKESADKLKSIYGDKIETSYGDDNKLAVEKAEVIIFGCKPFMFEGILKQIPSFYNKLIISLMAGWTISQLNYYSPRIARVMTNTPLKFGCGMAVVSLSPELESYEELVMNIVNPIGQAIKLPEKNMDAATSLVGSGPAFCLMFMESMIDGAVKMGIPYLALRECAAKVMEGTAKMCIETGDHPAVLKSQVCTPGGTTIGGLMVMEDKGVRSGIARGVQELAEIALSLGKK